MDAGTWGFASAFTVVESAVCIVISETWFNDDCDCWLLLSLPLPPPALGCDEDCPALDGTSFGLRGNKLAFNDGCIANSKNVKIQVQQIAFTMKKMHATYLDLWSWIAVEIHVHSVRLCCLLAARWRRDEHKPAMALFLRLACIQANVTLMQSLRVVYALGIPVKKKLKMFR